MGATQTLVSAEQFESLPDEQWRRFELSDGALTPRYGEEDAMGARYGHNRLRDRIYSKLDRFLESNPLGEAVLEQDFRLGEDTVRRPDLAFIVRDRLTIVQDDPAVVPGAPDLAVEVVSPTDRVEEFERKVEQLLAAGSRAVWVVFRDLQKVSVYDSGGRRDVRGPDTLEESEILPGFVLPVNDLFHR